MLRGGDARQLGALGAMGNKKLLFENGPDHLMATSQSHSRSVLLL